MLVAAVFATILYVVIFQVIVPVADTSFFAGTILGLYGGVIVTVTFLVSCFILITYLLSNFFKVPEWEAYLNVEMSNLMTSFLIVLFVIGLFAAGSAILDEVIGGAYPSPPQAAISYMQATVADSALRGMPWTSTRSMPAPPCSARSAGGSGSIVLTQTYKVFPGLDTFVSITNVLGFSLCHFYNTVSVQIGLLYFIDATMLNFFMPAGLVLRFFPPTRDAGAFLISHGLRLLYRLPDDVHDQQADISTTSTPTTLGGSPYQSARQS